MLGLRHGQALPMGSLIESHRALVGVADAPLPQEDGLAHALLRVEARPDRGGLEMRSLATTAWFLK